VHEERAIISSGSAVRTAARSPAQLRLAIDFVAHALDLVEDELLHAALLLRDLLLAEAGLGLASASISS
jgi:hypothetical protein